MRTSRIFLPSLLLAGLLASTPAWSANKEIVQLQTQVQQVLDQMARMQQSFDERMGVMRNLVEQQTDTTNKASAALSNLQALVEKQQADAGGRVEQLSGQIQTLNDSLDELKARLTKVSKQLEDMQAQQQNLQAQQQAAGAPGAQAPAAQAPPPDILYNNALRDYNGGKDDIASQEFADYVKYYPNTDLAGNAYFYLAEMQYRQRNFEAAAQNYDQVLQNFSDGNKAAAAQLKKGMALVQLGQRDEGIRELRRVVQRYPRSNEAVQAKEQLRKLGVSSAGGKPSAGR